MKILIDIDGTMTNFIDHFIKYLERADCYFDRVAYQETGTWELEEHIRGTFRPSNVLSQICESQEFWRDMPILWGVRSCVRKLNKEHEVIIATTPWKDEDKFKLPKQIWVREYFPYLTGSQLVFSNEKWTLDADMIIEDKPETLQKCSQAGMLTLKKLQPYNRDVKTDDTFNSWFTVLEKVNKLEKIKQRMV